MKKFILMGLVAFSIMVNAQSDPNLKWLHPSPQGWDLLWMKMFDANTWYFTGQYGVFMKTTDGGQTWKTNNKAGWPNTAYPEALTNWDANKAWFFDQSNGIICPRNGAGILRTSDGGETFDTLAILAGTPNGKNWYGIYFVNSNLGFICGNASCKIFKTTDGGNTWEALPNLPAIAYRDVFATDDLNITACTDNGGQIYKTTDGGDSWNVIQTPTTQPLYDLEFVNDTVGYVSGGVGFFKSTTDGGFTWTGGVNTPTSYTNYKIKAVNNEIYVAGDYTKMFKSTNGGASWDTLALNPQTNYSGFSYCMDVIGSTVVAAGRYGNIFKSTNGGSTFPRLSERLNDWGVSSSLYVGTSGKIIGTGHWSDTNPGCLIYSNDGGSTWQASPFVSGGSMLNRLQMFDNNNGYIIGNFGYCGKTTDGGLSLTPLSIPFSGGKNFIDLDFIDQNTGWLIGGPDGPGTVIVAKTTDGGLTWADQSNPLQGGRIKGIDMVDANIGYYAHLAVNKTTDGGTTWTALSTIPGVGNFEKVKAFDANNVYAVGNTGGSPNVGVFYKTTDGGTTWTQVPTPITAGVFFDQDWLDMNNGVIVGVLGLILKTSNGGTTWTVMNTGGWTVYDAQMISPDNYYVAGGNGQIFRYGDAAITTFQLTVNVANGWNMVSIPGLHPTNQDVITWWPGKDPAAGVFKFQAGYLAVTAAEPGIGYWMKHVGANTYNTGDEWPAGGINFVAHDPISAISGWNLFGGYEQSVSATAVTTTPPGLINGSIFKYSGGYVAATTIDPGYGYWVKLTGAGQINIPSALSGPQKQVTSSIEGFGKIIITDKTGSSYTLYSAKSNTDLNQYELPPMPPQGMFDVRYSSQRFAEKLSTAQTIEMTGVQYPVKIKAEGTGIILTDEKGKEIARLKTGEEVSVNTAGKLYVTENVVPLEFSLAQNYPNPFNPSTSIEFSLPENAANVKLSIYNALGQKVAELVNTSLAAGKYSYQWNAANAATGVYIYELRTEKFASIKKMMLLK